MKINLVVSKTVLYLCFLNHSNKLKMTQQARFYEIIFVNGSNRIEKFSDIKAFGYWWKLRVRLGIYKAGSVFKVKPI